MNQLNLLRDKLKPLLGWHGARLNFLALFLIALIRARKKQHPLAVAQRVGRLKGANSRAAGFAEHVIKPVDVEKLTDVIRRVWGG